MPSRAMPAVAPMRRIWSPACACRARFIRVTCLLWAVPRQAVLNDEKGDYLFEVKEGKAVRVEVKEAQGKEMILLAWMARSMPHCPSVTLGNYELEDGMPVREAKR